MFTQVVPEWRKYWQRNFKGFLPLLFKGRRNIRNLLKRRFNFDEVKFISGTPNSHREESVVVIEQ